MIHPEDAADFLLDYSARMQGANIRDDLLRIAERLRSMGFGAYAPAHRAKDLQLLADQTGSEPEPVVVNRLNEVAGLIRERI